MLSLSPLKLLIVLAVALVLLGPDKVPQLARQLGAAWRAFREFHEKIESDLRKSVPDLPSTDELVRLARSPVSVLDRLAKMPDTKVSGPLDAASSQRMVPDTTVEVETAEQEAGVEAKRGDVDVGAGSRTALVVPDDPSMN